MYIIIFHIFTIYHLLIFSDKQKLQVHFDGQQSLNHLLTPLPQSEKLNKKHEILQTLHKHILKASNAMIMFKTILESLDFILFEC